jgi:hypothetical protein
MVRPAEAQRACRREGRDANLPRSMGPGYVSPVASGLLFLAELFLQAEIFE